MITDQKLDFWIQNNLNVLFVGHAGVGKTAMVKDAFERNGLSWLYFSTATLDPFVDFCGIPKEVTDPETGIKYIDLVRPKAFAEDSVHAIFADELNRSHKKVRNALLELIQFRSINGKKFHNLRMIWAAINPEEVDPDLNVEYNVEKLDPAQRDRFHVIVNVPYKPSKSYFTKKYGDKFANAACAWWDDLDKKTKHLTSPRRLDYALDIYTRGGDLRDVLDTSCNITKLATELSFGPYEQRLKDIFVANDAEKAREFIANANNWQICRNKILTNNKYLEFFLPLLDSETLSSVVTTTKSVLDYVRNASNADHFRDSVNEIFKTYSDITKAPRELKALFVAYGVTVNNSPIIKGIARDFTDVEVKKLAKLKDIKLDQDRIKEVQGFCLSQDTNTWALTPNRQKLYDFLLFKQKETLTGNPAELASVANYIGIIMNRSHEMTLKTHFDGIQLLFVEVFNALTYLNVDYPTALAKFNFAPNGLQKCEKLLADNGFIKIENSER